MKGPVFPDTSAVPPGASAEVDCGVIDGDNLTLSVRAFRFYGVASLRGLDCLGGRRLSSQIVDVLNLSKGVYI